MSQNLAAYIVYGFTPNAPDWLDEDLWWEWWEVKTPEGFEFEIGGNHITGDGTEIIYHLPEHIVQVLNEWNMHGLGTHQVDKALHVTDEDRERVIQAARELGVDDQHVGYYVVSLVG